MIAAWRPLLAPALMISALLAGAYGLLVAPASRRLAEVRAEHATASSELQNAQTACGKIEEMTAALRHTADEADAMARASRLAGDRTAVFDAVTSLAAAHAVQLGRVDPMEEPASVTASAAAGPRTRAAYSIEVRGGFGAVAALVRDLQQDLGYTLLRSVRLTPAEGSEEGAVAAVIVTEHLAFDPSPRDLKAAHGGTP